MTGSEESEESGHDTDHSATGSATKGGDKKDCPLVVNELLCFIIQKLDLLPPDSIVQLCHSFYDPKTIRGSKNNLFEAINRPDLCRLVKRKGSKAATEDLKDMINLLQKCPEIPVRYVAGDLSRLPPITFNDIDVSSLLATMERMQTEMRLLKETQQAQALLVSDLAGAARSAPSPGPSVLPIQSMTFSDALRQNSRTPTPKSLRDNMQRPASMPPAASQRSLDLERDTTPQRARERTRNLTNSSDRRVGSGKHALKTATYAREGRLAEIFVSRLAPDVGCNDVKEHIRSTFKLDATVECVRATDYHTSYHVSVRCQNPRRLINPVNWPEGAFLKWWRRPRNPDFISDNTMGRIPMPEPHEVVTIDDSSLESFHSAKESNVTQNDLPISDKTMGGISDTVTGCTPPPISDRTMGNIRYSLNDLIRRTDSDSDSESRSSSPIRSPLDLFTTKVSKKKRRKKIYTSPALTRSRSRSNLNIAHRPNRPATRSVSKSGLDSHQ